MELQSTLTNYVAQSKTQSGVEYSNYKFDFEGFQVEARVFKYKVRFIAVCQYGGGYCSYFLPMVVSTEEFYNNLENVLDATKSHTKRKAFWMDDPSTLYDDKGVPYQAYMEEIGWQRSPLPGEVETVFSSICRYPKNTYILLFYCYRPLEGSSGGYTDQVLLDSIPEEKFNLKTIVDQIRVKLLEQGYDLTWS